MFPLLLSLRASSLSPFALQLSLLVTRHLTLATRHATPAPMEVKSYTIDQIAAGAGVSPRLVRSWVTEGLVPRPVRRRYSADQLLRVRVVKALRREGRSFGDIRSFLRKGSAELAAWLATDQETRAIDAARAAASGASPIEPPPLSFRGEAFQRVALAPGLELAIAASASPGVKRLADAIWKHFGPGPIE